MSAGRARGLSRARVLLLLLALGLPARRLAAQSCPDARTWRLATLTGGAAALEGLAIAAFHDEWWDTPRRDFHVLWGRSPAKGQDGLFHGLLGYHTASVGTAALRWACLSGAASAWVGAAGALLAPWPRWLGVAVGHGVPYWVTQPPEHIWYVAFDVEFSELPVPGDWWQGAAAFLDQFHLPAPGLRLRAGQLNIGLF